MAHSRSIVVSMSLAHRVRLDPTPGQQEYFRRACGVARFAYNWALAEWQRQYAAGEKPSEAALRRQLNGLKDEQFPWMREVTKNARQQGIKHLGRAYGSFFEDLAKHRRGELPWQRVRVPIRKKKGRHDAFRADNGPDKDHPDAVRTNGKCLQLPLIGWVAMRGEVRFAGRILSVTISRAADGWYASFTIEVEYAPDPRSDDTVVGVDLGITALATLSDGLSRSLSRKQRGSRNRVKAKTKLARLPQQIADVRAGPLHKLATNLTRYRTIVIEDLNVTGCGAEGTGREDDLAVKPAA
jgi:putative transposase